MKKLTTLVLALAILLMRLRYGGARGRHGFR